jgi:DNA-binding transcriptional MerR regulator
MIYPSRAYPGSDMHLPVGLSRALSPAFFWGFKKLFRDATILGMEPNETIIRAFTLDVVSRLTGLSQNQLKYWDRTGFFSPSLGHDNRRVANSRVYTFRDLLALQVLKVLRKDLFVPLQHLRMVKQRLSLMTDNEWGQRKLYVLNRKVVFDDAEGARREVVNGQYILDIPLSVVRENMEAAVAQLSQRNQSQFGHSEHKRGVVHNSEVFSGTRIPLSAVRAFIEDGFGDDAILEQYPSLKLADIRLVRAGSNEAA